MGIPRPILNAGTTGTNGKTSIAYHVSDLTNALGKRGGYCGTLGSGLPGSLTLGAMTTPPPVTLQKQFAHFREQGVERVALEVSSHALDQNRARDVRFDVGVFSNLTRDHLDYHKTMEQYAAAKAKMFTTWPLKLAVINSDDDMGRKLIGCVHASKCSVTAGLVTSLGGRRQCVAGCTSYSIHLGDG